MIEQIIILTQIIFIDIILAADNAIIIGLIAANFVPKNRKKIIYWGVAGALIFKIIFALFATYLFKFYLSRNKIDFNRFLFALSAFFIQYISFVFLFLAFNCLVIL